METHSSILAWRISQTEEPGGLQSMDGKESDTTERLTHSPKLSQKVKIFVAQVDAAKVKVTEAPRVASARRSLLRSPVCSVGCQLCTICVPSSW